MRLHDKVAIVTGGGGGMGRGICACLTREGADVVVSDLDVARAQETAAAAGQAGRRGLAVEGDVTSEEDCTEVVRQALDAFGQVDILVNNAGHFGSKLSAPFTTLTGDDWDENFAVNVKGPFFMCKAVAAHMMERRSGKIVNISSISAKRDPVFLPTYAAAKNALLNLTRVVAKDLGPYNVNVNAVLPGLVWTPFWERLAPMLAAQDPARAGQDPRAVFRRGGRRRRARTPADPGGRGQPGCLPGLRGGVQHHRPVDPRRRRHRHGLSPAARGRCTVTLRGRGAGFRSAVPGRCRVPRAGSPCRRR